jgi:hypothetical protein
MLFLFKACVYTSEHPAQKLSDYVKPFNWKHIKTVSCTTSRLSYPVLPDIRKKHCFLEGSQALIFCLSGKMGVAHFWNVS